MWCPFSSKEGLILYAKIHRIQENIVLACCTKELIGKTIEEGELCLKVDGDFYQGEEIDEGKLIEMLKEANNINLLGEKPIAIALREGFIKDNDLIRISGIPHVQIFKI